MTRKNAARRQGDRQHSTCRLTRPTAMHRGVRAIAAALSNRGVMIVCAAMLLAALTGGASAVTDTVFRYSTAHAGYLALPPGAFTPRDSDSATHYFITPYSIDPNGGNATCMTVGLNLPQAAKITAVAAWEASDTANGVKVTLNRNKASNGVHDQVLQLSSTDTSGARKPLTGAVPSALGTVDNHFYGYSLGVCLGSSNSIFYGARVTYTYTTAGD